MNKTITISRLLALLFTGICFSIQAFAQIGYQVALFNTATGEPRALETVNVNIDITDSKGNTILKNTYSSTSNEFGILSLTIGDSSTFKKVDWNNLPLFISATVDDILIGKTQILNVPVAEYAKNTGVLTKEILASKTWSASDSSSTFYYTFGQNGNCHIVEISEEEQYEYNKSYNIWGNIIAISNWGLGLYIPESNVIQMADDTSVMLK